MEVGAQQNVVGVPNPFSIFPALVWKNIICNLESPINLWNLLEVFPKLHEVTKPQEILLDKVLPLLFKDLDKKDVLACREVCKWWNKSVKNFLENHPSLQPYDPRSYSKQISYRYCTLESKEMSGIWIRTSYELEKICKESQDLMEHHKVIPTFIGRSLKFGRYCSTVRWFQAEKLLNENNAGRGVWYTDFILPDDGRCSTSGDFSYFIGLQKCLTKLPNLRALSVGESPLYSSLKWNFAAWNRQTGSLSSLQVPDIPSLKTLEMTGFTRWKSGSNSERWSPQQEFFHLLLNKYAPQLKKLRIASIFWKDEYGTRLQNLTEFCLILESIAEGIGYTYQRGSEDSRILRSVISNLSSPNLKKFGVEMKGDCSFQFLKGFCEEIETRSFNVLTIRAWSILPDIKERQACYQNTLPSLPSVLWLTLKIGSGDPKALSTYLSAYFPNLEYMEIRIEYNEKLIQHHLRTSEIAAVWKLYPNMKTFVINNDSYAREMYERD